MFLAYLGMREHDSECDKCVKCEAIRMKTVLLWQYVLHVYSLNPRGVALPSATCIDHYGGYASDQVIAVTNIALSDCFGDEF